LFGSARLQPRFSLPGGLAHEQKIRRSVSLFLRFWRTQFDDRSLSLSDFVERTSSARFTVSGETNKQLRRFFARVRQSILVFDPADQGAERGSSARVRLPDRGRLVVALAWLWFLPRFERCGGNRGNSRGEVPSDKGNWRWKAGTKVK
jgi:hypothetical protein